VRLKGGRVLVRKKGEERMLTMGRNSWSAVFEESWWVAGGGEGDSERKKERKKQEGRMGKKKGLCDGF
jgi:hypothetical protein